MKARPIRIVLTVVAWALSAVALLYVGMQMVTHFDRLQHVLHPWRLAGTIGLVGALHALTMVLLAWAYGALLMPSHPGLRAMIDIYGRSQIMKYVPGNVLVVAGRQVLGGAYGVPQASLGVATFLETLFLVTACATVMAVSGLGIGGRSLAGLDSLMGTLPRISDSMTFGLIGAAMLALLWMLIRQAHRLPLLRRWISPAASLKLTRPLSFLLPLVLQASWLALCGIMLWIMAQLQLDQVLSPAPFVFAFAGAWILGYITPTAPGGLGLREAVLVLILTPEIGQGEAALLAIAHRLATAIGDVGLFGLAIAVAPRRMSLSAIMPRRRDTSAKATGAAVRRT